MSSEELPASPTELEGLVARLAAADTSHAFAEILSEAGRLLAGLESGALTGQGSQEAVEALLRSSETCALNCAFRPEMHQRHQPRAVCGVLQRSCERG